MTTLSPLLLVAMTLSPLETVRQADSSVSAILKGPEPRLEKLTLKADESIDFAELAKRTLGKTWVTLSKKQQEQFSVEMKALLRASYAQRALNENPGGTAGFQYVGETVASDGKEATVETTLSVKTDKFPVQYKLYKSDAKAAWRIYDVITDGVSLVSTYQDQFRQVIAKKGIDGLVATIKTKRIQLESASKTKDTTPAQ